MKTNDELKEVVLRDIVSFRNGKGHEQFISEDGKYIVVNSKYISSDRKIKKYSNSNLSPLYKDDLVMVMSDVPNGKAIAKFDIIGEDDKYTLNQRIGAFSTSQDTKYLYYALNRNKYFLAFDDGVKQTNLKKEDILSLKLLLPPLEKQKKIGKILSSIDDLIEKSIELDNLYSLKKKSFKQQFFNVETKLRFNDYINDGISTSFLKKHVDFFNGKEPKNIEFLNGNKKYLGKSDLYSLPEVITTFTNKVNFDEESSVYLSKGNEVLLPSSTNTKDGICSPSALMEKGIVIGGDINILKCIDCDNKYISYWLSANETLINSITQGSTVYHLYNKHLSMLKIPFVSIEEQRKISSLLYLIDELIDYQRNITNEYKELKKHYLNLIFK